MTVITADHFSLKQISESGQCFRMTDMGGGFYRIIARDKMVFAGQDGASITLSCDEKEYRAFWYEYFDLGTDYRKYIDQIDPDDKYLNAAARFGSGIRILKQDPWEMIVTFLISQRNNIPRIKKCIELLCSAYGKRMTCANKDGMSAFNIDGAYEEYYSFPEAEVLAALDDDALMACNLGYRSRYVVRTARIIAGLKEEGSAVTEENRKGIKADDITFSGMDGLKK